MVPVAMTANFTVTGVVKRSLADIKAGDYIASTSVRGPDGHLRALEIRLSATGSWQILDWTASTSP